MRHYKQISTAAIVCAEALKLLPVKGRMRRWVRVASAALGLVGGFAMRWAMVHGGHEAAGDPGLARLNSRALALPASRVPAGEAPGAAAPERPRALVAAGRP